MKTVARCTAVSDESRSTPIPLWLRKGNLKSVIATEMVFDSDAIRYSQSEFVQNDGTSMVYGQP